MPVETAQTHPYTLLAAVLFAFAWILTMLLWWLFRHRPHKPKLTQRTTRSNLRQACAVNNPEQALAALLAWSHQQWPQTPPLNLSELSTLVRDIEFKQQIILLTRALYAKKDPNIWHGESLWQAVKRYQPSKEESVIKNNPLPPINPDLSVLK